MSTFLVKLMLHYVFGRGTDIRWNHQVPEVDSLTSQRADCH